MSATTRRTQSCGACDMLRRKMFTPASMSLPIISAESVAGPSVEMIFVWRRLPRCMGERYKSAGGELKAFNRRRRLENRACQIRAAAGIFAAIIYRLNLWQTLQTNIPKTSPANTTWTTSALTATCAAKPRRTISSATTTAAIPSSTSSRPRPTKKRAARKPRKAAPSKPSATTAA